jgi:glutamate 5-kinase
VEAEVLIILTDQPGLYTADPRKDPSATLVQDARAGDPALEAMAGGAGSDIGSGGMLTKVLAARRAARSGAHTVIASGREDRVLMRLAEGEKIGSQLAAETPTLAARKQWLADHLQLRGKLVLDDGAVHALRAAGKSLLPIGVQDVQGDFERGEVVACLDAEGREVARGLVNYSAGETRRIVRTPSAEIEEATRLHRRARTDPPRQPRPVLSACESFARLLRPPLCGCACVALRENGGHLVHQIPLFSRSAPWLARKSTVSRRPSKDSQALSRAPRAFSPLP